MRHEPQHPTPPLPRGTPQVDQGDLYLRKAGRLMIRWLISIGLIVPIFNSPLPAILMALLCAAVITWGLLRLLAGGVW